jgi:hypothetical protein
VPLALRGSSSEAGRAAISAPQGGDQEATSHLKHRPIRFPHQTTASAIPHLNPRKATHRRTVRITPARCTPTHPIARCTGHFVPVDRHLVRSRRCRKEPRHLRQEFTLHAQPMTAPAQTPFDNLIANWLYSRALVILSTVCSASPKRVKWYLVRICHAPINRPNTL